MLKPSRCSSKIPVKIKTNKKLKCWRQHLKIDKARWLSTVTKVILKCFKVRVKKGLLLIQKNILEVIQTSSYNSFFHNQETKSHKWVTSPRTWDRTEICCLNFVNLAKRDKVDLYKVLNKIPLPTSKRVLIMSYIKEYFQSSNMRLKGIKEIRTVWKIYRTKKLCQVKSHQSNKSI